MEPVVTPPVVTPPGGGRRIRYAGQAVRVLYEAPALAVVEMTVPAGFGGTLPHVHHGMDEGFHVVDGTLTMVVGQETVQVGAGGFVMATRGTRHAFSNPGEAPAHLLGTMSPGIGVALLDGLAELVTASGAPDPAAIAALYREHGSELV